MTFDFPASAFAGFYDSSVAVSGTRPNGLTVRGTFAACVMPAERVDPFAEDAAQAKVFKCAVLIPKVGPGGWNLPQPPQIGDSVTIKATTWKVASVDPHCDDNFVLEVRSC